jgi:hypothetical protein
MFSLDRDLRLPRTDPEQRDRMPPATGKGAKLKKDEVKVTDPKTAPVDAEVEAHKKLDNASGEAKTH